MHPTTMSSLHNRRASAIGGRGAEHQNDCDADVAAENRTSTDSRRHRGTSRSRAGRLMVILALGLYLVGVAVLLGRLSSYGQAWTTSLCRLLGYR